MSSSSESIKDPKMVLEMEKQAMTNFIAAASTSVKHISNAFSMLNSFFFIYAEELSIHRQLEKHLREGTVTEELLQHYLDSLVAFRDRMKGDMEEALRSHTAATH